MRADAGGAKAGSAFAPHGVPMALATSSDSVLYRAKTRRHQDWFGLFDTIIKGDDAALEHGKPAPDIFLLAAERIGVPAARALVFEDAPSGLAAGIAAQMSVIAVPDPNMDRQRYHGAAEILSSLAQFRPEAYGLPAFERPPNRDLSHEPATTAQNP